MFSFEAVAPAALLTATLDALSMEVSERGVPHAHYQGSHYPGFRKYPLYTTPPQGSLLFKLLQGLMKWELREGVV